MSDQEMTRHDQILMGLVFSLQASAMQQMGKIQNPMTGEMEKDLDHARSSIDILEMLKVKCRSETPADVLRLLDSAVMDLQLNYMDEMKKAQAQSEEAPEEPAAAEAAADATRSDPEADPESTEAAE